MHIHVHTCSNIQFNKFIVLNRIASTFFKKLFHTQHLSVILYSFHTALLLRNFITTKIDEQQCNISRISSVRHIERDIQLIISFTSATVSEITTRVMIKLQGFGTQYNKSCSKLNQTKITNKFQFHEMAKTLPVSMY